MRDLCIFFLMHAAKARRHEVILRLLDSKVVSNQEDLRKELKEKGFEVTQATLSRDLKELGIIKQVTAEGGYTYAVPVAPERSSVVSCEVSSNLLVLKTRAGAAATIAYRIDDLEMPSVLGTVAGEDTLLAVIAEGEDSQQVRDQLMMYLKRS